MNISEEDIKTLLETDGHTWNEFFVLNSQVIARRDSNGQLFAMIIEDDDLEKATKEFLIVNGYSEESCLNK
jgi:hypothetical protein